MYSNCRAADDHRSTERGRRPGGSLNLVGLQAGMLYGLPAEVPTLTYYVVPAAAARSAIGACEVYIPTPCVME